MSTHAKKLQIAILLPTIISKNGTAKQSLELAKILQSHGHLVSFFTYAYLKTSSFPEFKNFLVYSCVNIEKSLVYKIIKNVSSLETIYLYLALLFIKRFRNLFNGKNITIYNPHDWMGLWVVTGLKNSKTIVANINDVPQRNSGFINRLKLIRDRKYKNKIDHIVVLDNSNKRKATEWLNISSQKISVIRSGIDLGKYKKFNKKYDIKKDLHLTKKDSLLVCANLLAPNRRYEDVLSVMAKFKKKGIILHVLILAKLDFNPSYAELLKKIIREDHLEEQVHFIDKFFSDEERMLYIQNSDVLIFPNSPQTWGLTVIEAMALGVPVIVSSGSGVSEVLQDNINAYVYKGENRKELSAKIDQYLQHTSESKKIAARGREYVLKTFSWEKFGGEIEELMLQDMQIKK
jgi:glycosyltransferase involved in cell wall biosynthesis